MKLLIVTQKVNINDPILGFFHRWIEEFAKHYEKVIVICLEKGECSLPNNVEVYSLGKEEGESKIKYISRFYKYIWNLRKEYDVVFVHMNQVYVVLGGIFWRIWNKKIGLWYVHRQKSFSLRLSTYLADTIFTSSKESFGYTGVKVNYLGHGIDMSKYSQTNISPSLPKTILYIGRITPIKNIEIFINALEKLNNKLPGEYHGVLIGEAITADDKKYKNYLDTLISDANLTQIIEFKGSKKSSEIPAILASCWATVNLSPTGGMDKVVLESLASNRPVFASNLAFNEVFGEYRDIFIFRQNDSQNLALKIEEFAKLSNSYEIMKNLSDNIQKEFNIPVLINKIKTTLNTHE